MQPLFPLIRLASTSVQRQVLLTQIGVEFKSLSIRVDESPQPGEMAANYVCRLALAKARAGWRLQPSQERLPVLGADTAVVIDNEILGKPKDQAHAGTMLARLSGRSHRVLSAVALVNVNGGEQYRLSASTVIFKQLTVAERQHYLASGEGLNKAGAYGIQGQAACFISHLEGSYSGVMGLPLYETGELLQNLRIKDKNSP